jgi:acetate kinase
VLADLQELVPIDPDHLPQALAVIQVITEKYPAIPQVACFDTAFHRSMSSVAQMYPEGCTNSGPTSRQTLAEQAGNQFVE